MSSLQRHSAGPKRQTAHQYVVESLRNAIVEGALSPGTRLIQAAIAEELEVSTTPVREALRDLAAEGLVRLDPHRGAVVYGIDLEECREIYELRMLLEPYAVRQVLPELKDERLGEARVLQEQMDVEHDPQRWAELNRAFHRLLTEPVRSRQLSEILQRLQSAAESYVRLSLRVVPEQMASANVQHAELLEAIADGDVDRVERMVVDHLKATLAAIEQAPSEDVVEPAGGEPDAAGGGGHGPG